MDNIKKEVGSCIKQEKDIIANSSDKKDSQNNAPKIEKDSKDGQQRAKELKINESELVRDLKTQLK